MTEAPTPSDLDPSELDPMRKRVLFRCHHCGIHENDILLGGFADAHVRTLTEDQLGRLEGLLVENDIDLFKWITGKEPPPPALDHDVMNMIKNFSKQKY